jgi:hypothetical protein
MMNEPKKQGPQARKAQVGARGQKVWFAYRAGSMLRNKRGVGRRFKTEKAALNAAKAEA